MDSNEFNFKMNFCEQELIKALNESNLPVGALLYIIKNIYNELNAQYIASINSYSLNNPISEEKHSIKLINQQSQVE